MSVSRALAMSISMATCLLAAGTAAAQEEWKEDGGEKPPPDDRPAKKKDDPKPADPNEKPKRVLVELKLGPAFILSSRGITEFGLQVNLGYAVANGMITPGDAFYLTLSPYMIVGEDLTLVTPLGVQYELPLKMIPYEGISVHARVNVGYAYYKPPLLDFDKGYHGVGVQPALGAKLSFLERFHVGIEPIGFDIITVFPPKDTNQPTATASAFQLYIFGGAKF
jgi:hypothetical protein